MSDTSADPALLPPSPVDHVLEPLVDAVRAVTIEPAVTVGEIARDIAAFLDAPLRPAGCNAPADPAEPRDADLASAAAQRLLDRRRAETALDAARRRATAESAAQEDNWQIALSQYASAQSQARATLHHAVVEATRAFKPMPTDGTAARAAIGYFEVREALAAAMQAYAAANAAAAAVLAAEAGRSIAAFAASVGSLETAQAQHEIELAAADQSYWQNVEAMVEAR